MCRSKNAGVAGYAEAFRPVQSDSQTSGWYSYFENDVLDQYEYLMEKGEFLTDIQFTQEIKDKGLQAYEGDVQLIMPTEESTLYKGIFGSTYLLERCYNVKITKVDRETMTVYLSYRAAQAEYRPQLWRR